MLILFSVAALGLSGFAGWFFFGGPEDDPTRVKLAAALSQIEALKPKAQSGGIRAKYELARLYHLGKFGSRNLPEAYKWYSRAAEKGHPGAQYAIGTFFAEGKVVKQNYYRAADWYFLASNLGRNPDAQFALGEFYFNGRGVPHGYAEAWDWYAKAAEQGHPVAQFRLGAMIAEGWAGGFDAVEAYKWFTLALPGQGRVAAHDPKLDVGAALDMLARDMNENQIKRAEAAARAWRANR